MTRGVRRDPARARAPGRARRARVQPSDRSLLLEAVRFLLEDASCPRLGDGASGRRGPYVYLARTIGDFPAPDLLAGMIREAGFAAVGWQPLTGGIVCVHTALKA